MNNKYQKAFDKIKNVVVFNKNYRDYANDLKVIQELVDKETPMKPNGIQCAKCGSLIMEDTRMGAMHFHRCRNINCGQKIDWGNENIKD